MSHAEYELAIAALRAALDEQADFKRVAGKKLAEALVGAAFSASKLAAAEAELDLTLRQLQEAQERADAAELHAQEVIADCDEYQRTVADLRDKLAAAEAVIEAVEAHLADDLDLERATKLDDALATYRATHD